MVKLMNKREILKLQGFLLVFVTYMVINIIVGVTTYDVNDKTAETIVSKVETVSLLQENGQTTQISLPRRLYSKEQFSYLVDISPYKNIENCSLTTICNFVDLDVYAGEEVIYSKKSNRDQVCASGGHYLVIFDLPNDLKTDTLRFVYKPIPTSQNYTYLSEIEVAEKSDLILKEILGKETFFLNLLLLFLYILNILYVLLLAKSFVESNNFGTIYLSFLALIVALYFSMQLWIVKFVFLPLSSTLYFLEYISMIAMLIPFLVFFKYQLDVRFKKSYSIMIILATINLFGQTFFAFVKHVELVDMLLLSHLNILASLLFVGVTYYLTDGKKYPQKRKFKYPLIFILPVLAFSVIYYRLTDKLIFHATAVIVCTSFIVVEVVELHSKFKDYQNERVEKELYKKMANTDSLTGLKNRTAYNLFTSSFDARTDHIAGWIISLDLNDLKTINDSYGHIKGDEYIINFANLLKREVAENENIEAYRVGGDEFFVFIEATESFDVAAWIDKLREAFKNTADPLEELTPTFAAGSYYLTQYKSVGFNHALHQADQKMYQNKKVLNE
ncbi:MAG: hypothetical protein CSB19_00395 [Clostridiales bacterium]|nr:MAG: hypothetical protein CSB19_00395 [Clostridiales bacterium]